MTSPAVQDSPVTVPPHLAVRHIRSYHFLPSLSRTCRKKYQRTTASSSRCAALSSVSSLSASSLCLDFLCLLHHLLRLCVCVRARAKDENRHMRAHAWTDRYTLRNATKLSEFRVQGQELCGLVL